MKKLWLLILLSLPLSVLAQTAEQRGLEIAIEADRRDTGFHDSRASLQMVLRNKQGKESTRQIRVRTLEQPDDGDDRHELDGDEQVRRLSVGLREPEDDPGQGRGRPDVRG